MGKEISFFEQASLSGRTQLANMSPGDADALFKIFYLIRNIIKHITIRNSALCIQFENKPSTLLYADLSKLIGQNVDFSFLVSNECLAKLKKIKGDGNVLIIDDYILGKYLVTNGKSLVELHKYAGPAEPPSIPDIDEREVIGAEIQTDEASLILDSLKKTRFVTLHIFGDQFGIIRGDKGEMFCLNENSFFEYEQKQPSWIFRSYAFMEVSSQFMNFRILSCNQRFWLHTSVFLGFDMIIEQFEMLDFVEGGTA